MPRPITNDDFSKQQRDEALEMVNALSRYVNHYRNKDILVRTLAQEHPTLQQQIASFCLMYLKHLSKLTPNEYDQRLEAAVQKAKKIMANLDDYETQLPYI